MEEVLERARQYAAQEGFIIFRSIRTKGEEVFTNCPAHAEGNESHPSFSISTGDKRFGVGHCFACGFTGGLEQIISTAFGKDDRGEWGEEWLNWNFGRTLTDTVRDIAGLPEDRKGGSRPGLSVIPESVLVRNDRHPEYLRKRGISDEVMDLFDVRFEKTFTFKDGKIRPAVMFPWRDRRNEIRMILRRSTVDKVFDIPEGVVKPVYGLSQLWKAKMVYPDTVLYVCESVIDALTLWTWGYPAVALLGTGTEQQALTLSKLRNRTLICCFDGDEAGEKGYERLKASLKDKIVKRLRLPHGKDINDLEEEEFNKLKVVI